MRLKIDEVLCSGHGRCWKYAPDVFPIDDDGFNLLRGSIIEIPADQEEAATKGMKACPERAITMID